ncbi:hypothetical protein GTE7_gp022 [Gordonia phage GTE7]|uniref:Minor tail protein n=1 Tax=Gordonia phage GTE7 TaxID=1100814 RepID=G8FS15_9CAUD|nr:hypothetical protein GTE7_gp022 [Gordonia phage GTE7]AER26565.1 hypothetical protein [Gordonia phage GTE7]
MATGLGQWETTTKIHSVLKTIAQGEIERMRPASRLAEVTQINPSDKSVLVKFVGETNEVKVPYTSTAPANTGQWVRVGGTTHDRHVEDVIGTTDTEARLENNESHINSLMSSILGPSWSDDDDGESGGFVDQITDFFNGLGGGAEDTMELIRALADNPLGTLEDAKNKIGKMIESAFGLINPSRIPLLPASHVGKNEPNILANYTFESAITIETGGAWVWDGVEGRTAPGCAKTTANGTRKVLTSVEVKSDAGQSLDFEGYVKWDGVTATGNAFQLTAVTYTGESVVSETVIQSITNPAVSGGWTKLSGTYVIPEGITAVRLRIVVTSTTTAGTVWFDDLLLKKTGSIKQGLISNLIPDLSGLWTNFTNVFQFITGIPGATLTTLQTWIGQLKNILGGISIPGGSILPTLSQAINSTISGVQDFVQNLLDAIIKGIRRVPFVGGGIADVLSALTGFANKTEGDHQSLMDNVWTGATQPSSEVVVGKTDEEIRQAVAALKARAEAATAAQEMEFLSAVPLWQGLIPGGDVTTPLQGVNSEMTSTNTSNLMTLFRPRSSFPIERISFMGKVASGTNPLLWTAARLLLASYDEDTNMWRCVARSADFRTELGTAISWIHTTFLVPYVPRVGEDLAIIAKPYAGGTDGFAVSLMRNTPTGVGVNAYTIPPSSIHPRAITALVTGASTMSDVGDSFSGDDGTKVTSWTNGLVPFYHYSPDLGQVETYPPLYWFDDFNSFTVTESKYKKISSTSLNATFSSGKMEFNGTTDGRQGILYTTPMNTDFMSVQADVVYDAVNYGETTCSVIGIHQDVNGVGGVHLTIDRTAGGSVVMRTGGSLSTPITGTTVRASIMSGHNPEGRWELFYDAPTSTYRVVHNGVGLGALTWTDGSNSIGRGKVRRYTMLNVGRASFQDSLGWDNLLIKDIT